MITNIKENSIEINSKYYSIIEYYSDDLVGQHINLNLNKEISISIASIYDEGGDIFVLIILECDDVKILNEGLNKMSWFDEDILVNRKFLNE